MEDGHSPLLISGGGPLRPGGQQLHGGTAELQCQQVGGERELRVGVGMFEEGPGLFLRGCGEGWDY